MEQGQDHRVLALKYRPITFSEIIEQDTAVRALQNAFSSDRLGSGYLFFGARGVGKTSIARIIARRVNCASPVGNEPCNRCESCRSILEGNSMDVMEIDAASHRGIQNIRELRESVRFQPMSGKKKVYIIDEVHMLTLESFNALLKTLEEPPPHALFLLATTELNKIPETILSRCQVFVFRKVPIGRMQEYLSELCKKEGIHAEEEALFWLARKGDGSVRDSLSYLETAMTYCGSTITAEQVKELAGVVWTDAFLRITEAMLREEEGNREDFLKPVHEIYTSGGDLNRFVWDYLDFLRVLTHILHGIQDTEFLAVPGSEIAEIKERLGEIDPVRVGVVFEGIHGLLSKTYSYRLRSSYETRVLIEMELHTIRERLARPSLSGILSRINRLSAAIREGKPYSPENDLQESFLGTVVDPEGLPRLE